MEHLMSRIFSYTFILGLAFAGPALAQTTQLTQPTPHCRADTISNTNGLGIRLSSGLTYGAEPGGTTILSSWLPLDRVKVCRVGGGAVEITNLDRHNAKIEALRTDNANSATPN